MSWVQRLMSLWKPAPRKADPSVKAPLELREAVRKLEVTSRKARMQTHKAKKTLEQSGELFETMDDLIRRLNEEREDRENGHA